MGISVQLNVLTIFKLSGHFYTATSLSLGKEPLIKAVLKVGCDGWVTAAGISDSA
jgi:hypothetical protein